MQPHIRTIKPEFFLHEELFDLEQETGLPIRVAFAGLFCQADREGRFQWRLRTLKMLVLPYDNVDFSRVLDALATRGFIVKYASKGELFGWIPGFLRHQTPNNRERSSVLPDPNASDCEILTSTRDPRVPDACPTRDPRVPQGREGKGRERSKDASGTRHAFAKPTLEEVAAYCRERQNGIDPQGFIDHYESNGWMVGKVKMKDWRASVRTWEKNDHGQKSLPLKDDQQTQYLN